MEFTYNPVFSDDGRPAGIVGIGVEVTAPIEAANRENDLYLAIYGAMMMAEYAPDGQIRAANDLFLEAFQYRREDLVGRDRSLLHAPDQVRRPGYKQQWDYICAGNIYSAQLECQAADGQPVWVEGVFAPIFDDGGTLAKIAFFALNVTWRVSEERRDQENIQRLAAVCERSMTAIVILDKDNRTLYINNSFTRMFGYTRDEMLGGNAGRIFGPGEREVAARLRDTLKTDRALHLEEVAYGKDGQRFWVACSVSRIADDEGRPLFLEVVITDITDVKMNERLQHKALEAMARDLPLTEISSIICREVERIMPDTHLAVIGLDGQNRLAVLGRAGLPPECVRAITGRPVGPEAAPSGRAVALGHPVAMDEAELAGYADPAVRQIFSRAGITGCWSVPIRSGDGDTYGAVTFYKRDGAGNDHFQERLAQVVARLCAVAIEREKIRESMRRLTFFDDLTGLPNRAFLITTAERMLKSARRAGQYLAVIVISLDRANFLHESLGHRKSDLVLRRVADSLCEHWPNSSEVLGRLSGHDLAVILADRGPGQVVEAVAEIQALVARPIEIDEVTICPTASLGISVFPTDGAEVEVLLHQATLAMGQARSAGFGRFRFFVPEQDERAREALAMESALRRALGGPEIKLHFQPQINLETGKLAGAEALIRWTNPIFGYVPPDRFIALTEASGLIREISAWVLDEACRQLGRWRRQGLPVPSVSVNLSAINFGDPDFLEYLMAALQTSGLTPRDLVLELTEGVFMNPDSTVLAVIDQACQAGFRFSVDDFGTGYSCLSYLHRLPISELKLDRSFVLDFHEKDISRRISQAIMGIGQSLGLTLVAEGVETEEQLRLLKLQGWHAAQGFYFSPPLAGPDFAKWLAGAADELAMKTFPSAGGRDLVAAWPEEGEGRALVVR